MTPPPPQASSDSGAKPKRQYRLDIDASSIKPGCGWGSAFAAAASVKLEEVDDAFLERTRSQEAPLAGIAELVRTKRPSEQKEPPPPKRHKTNHEESASKASSSGDSSSDEKQTASEPTEAPAVLEGRMVTHPKQQEEQIMVLVDKTKQVVYSATKRNENGGMIAIGKLKNGWRDQIEWNDNIEDDDNDDNEKSERDEVGTFPFPTDSDDHCESPLEAYQDILPLLERIFPKKHECTIYDPYYCDGAVKRNLGTLGFSKVHNVKEDCYHVWSSKTSYPTFDTLITNPPYSQEHIPKLIKFLSSPKMSNKPWFLLMPQWVSKKPYFIKQWDKRAFFLVPKKRRYVYVPPKNFREKKASDVHKKSSPFVTIWFVWGGSKEKTDRLYDFYRNKYGKDAPCDLARSKNGLRDLRRKKGKN